MVTRIAGDGRLMHRLVDTATRGDSDRWESLVHQAALAYPPPYEPVPDIPVYLINTGEQPVLVTQNNLTGPMEELVSAVLAEGEPVQRPPEYPDDGQLAGSEAPDQQQPQSFGPPPG